MTKARLGGMRILVGAGSFADAATALDILKSAARQRQMKMTLGGMLIVDQMALALCRIPNQRIITGTGAMAISPSPSRVTALIEADAKAFRKSLAELADPIGAKWLFEQTMGNLVTDVLRARSAWDVIVFGHRKTYNARGKIVVISRGGTQSDEMSAFADTLAGQKVAERVDLVVGDSSITGAAPPAVGSFGAAIASLSRMSPQAVLIDLSTGLVKDTGNLQDLLDAARCPVFVFGAGSLRSEDSP